MLQVVHSQYLRQTLKTIAILQEEYAQLQQKYSDLKERKIQDLNSMLEEHTAKLMAHNETAVKLADH